MGIPWMRIAFLLLAVRGAENVESTLVNVGHMTLSWGLGELAGPLGRRLVLFGQARRRERTWDEARKLARIPTGQMVISGLVTLASLALLLYTGHSQMPLFLLSTAFILPVFQSWTFPVVWPSVLFIMGGLAAIWLWEGVRPLFMGLLLFQLLPTLQEVLKRAQRGRRTLSVAAWWAFLLVTLPLCVVSILALYRPNILGAFLDANAKGHFPPAVTRAVDGVMKALGAMRGPDDPWRTLGVPRNADMREIKKKVRELSLMFHPDKTGNNPLSAMKFLKIQAAAEQLTKKDAASNSQRLHAEATQDAVTRCVEVSFVVGFWVALSAVAAVGQFLNPPPPEEVLLQQQQAMAAAAAAAAEGAGRPGGAVVLEPTVPSGGIFGQMFGLSAGPTITAPATRGPVPLGAGIARGDANGGEAGKKGGKQGGGVGPVDPVAAEAAAMAERARAAAVASSSATASRLAKARKRAGR